MSGKYALRSGSLTTPLTIQSPSTEKDELGQPIEGWTDVAMVWGDIRHLSGSEAIKAGAVASSVNASIRIRWRTGIDASMRLLADGRVYAIKAVMPDLRGRQYVDILAEVQS